MNSHAAARNKGFSLLEVLVALAILAMIATMCFAAFSTAEKTNAFTQRKLEQIQRMDRFWIALEKDLKHALGYVSVTPYGDTHPAMLAETGESYWLMAFRGGRANPLNLPRTELTRVGYRLEEDVVWRDSWLDPANPQPENAMQQKLLDGVDEVRVRLLPKTATGFGDDYWTDQWPPLGRVEELPLAVEVTLVMRDQTELKRLFRILPGV